MLLRATLLESHQEGGYGVASYRGVFLIPADDEPTTRTITYYARTLTAPLPERALLVVREDPFGVLRIIGGDVQVGVFDDTEENRCLLIVAVQEGTLLPSEQRWLPRDNAIELAMDAVGVDRESGNWRPTNAVRYEFGWEVFIQWMEAGMTRVGAFLVVVVGDDGEVKHIHSGL